MEKVYHGNSNQKKAKLAILISDKVGFIANKITTDRERRFIIKGSVPKAANYVKQKLTDEKMEK